MAKETCAHTATEQVANEFPGGVRHAFLRCTACKKHLRWLGKDDVYDLMALPVVEKFGGKKRRKKGGPRQLDLFDEQ